MLAPLLVLGVAMGLAASGCSDGGGLAEPEPERLQGEGVPLRAVPEARMERLRRGVNVGSWFSQATITPEHLATYVTGDDARLIREVGFGHVRIPFDPDGVFAGARPTESGRDRLDALDAAIEMFLAEDLAVIVDLHPTADFKSSLEANPWAVEGAALLWNALAYRLRTHDPERVFFEALNEPGFESVGAWERTQATLVEAIRVAAPRHTILATTSGSSGPDEFPAATPVGDPNVVYVVHFYEPHTFTHQGATWGWEPWAAFHDLPYPSSPEAVAPVLPQIDADVQRYVESYGAYRWNRDRLREALRPAVAWAERHGVRLVCTEFGVYRLVAPEASRLAWLRDARTVLEEAGVGWSVWDYSGGFRISEGVPGARRPDPDVIEALGYGP